MRQSLPELPDAKYRRFVAAYGLPENDARILVEDVALADYFEAAVRGYGGKAVSVSKWVVGELAYLMNRDGIAIERVRVAPESIASLVKLLDAGTISQSSAKDVLGTMFESGRAPEAIVKEKGLVQISDQDQLAQVVDQVLADHPEEVTAYLEGRESLLQWFMGQVMRATRGRAQPQTVLGLLRAKLEARR